MIGNAVFPANSLYEVLGFNRVGKTANVTIPQFSRHITVLIVASIAHNGERLDDNFFGDCFDNGVFNVQRVGHAGALQNCDLLNHSKGTQGGYALFGRQQATLLLQSLSALGITFEGGGHELVVHPLVTDKQEAVAGFVILYIFIRNINELGGQFVLLLQGGIGQGSVDGVLGQIRALLSIEGGVDVFSGTHKGCAYIINGNVHLVHLVNHVGIFRDVTGHLVGHVHQGAELLRACVHYHISGNNTVLVVRIARHELLHIGKALVSGFAGKTGRLADVATGAVFVNGPVHQGGNDETHGANDNHRAQNDKTFFVFHGSYDLKLFLLQVSGTKVAGNKKTPVKPHQFFVKIMQKQAPTCKTPSILRKNPANTTTSPLTVLSY